MNIRLNKIKRLYESVSKNAYKKFTLKESKLNEGAGAGYTVSGLVTEFNVTNILTKKLDSDKYYKLHCDCEGTAKVTNLHASSYMYGNDIAKFGEIPVKVTSVIVYIEDEEKEKIKDDAWLLELVNSTEKFNFEAICGGGYIHSTFEGELNARADEASSNIDTATLVIENDRVIKAIDDAVTGNDWITEYVVYDENNDLMDYFDDEGEAIDFAKKNKGVRVDKQETLYQLLGDFESEDVVDTYGPETVWEREYSRSYKYEESLQEKKCHKELKEKLEESSGVDVIEELVDRVKSYYEDDLEDAVERAIDDGVIYTEDIFALMDYLGSASDVADLFFQNYYDALFNELYKTAKERLGIEESLNEEKSLPIKDEKFLNKIKEIANNAFNKAEKDDAKALAEIDRLHDAGEITDEEHEYITNYYDTLVDAHYTDDDLGRNEKTMWYGVYDEIFSGKPARLNKVPTDGTTRVSYELYFDPEKKNITVKKGTIGIGVIGEEGVKRAKQVADALNLEVKNSKSGNSVIVLLPEDKVDIKYKDYLKSIGK